MSLGFVAGSVTGLVAGLVARLVALFVVLFVVVFVTLAPVLGAVDAAPEEALPAGLMLPSAFNTNCSVVAGCVCAATGKVTPAPKQAAEKTKTQN